eukprot:75343-Pyramimonas_sp.AAC.1
MLVTRRGRYLGACCVVFACVPVVFTEDYMRCFRCPFRLGSRCAYLGPRPWARRTLSTSFRRVR